MTSTPGTPGPDDAGAPTGDPDVAEAPGPDEDPQTQISQPDPEED